MDNDLFGVFDEQPGADRSDISAATSKGTKRMANGMAKDRSMQSESDESSDEEEDMDEGDSGDGKDADNHGDATTHDHDAKRPKRDLDEEQQPVVADSFETEQQREVAAAAGLQGSKEKETVVLAHQVRHQVALPPSFDYTPLSKHKAPEDPARTYPFTLDPFQQLSVHCIQRNESVLVSAHTSAGKTVVAEYAIAQCLKNNQRVIYTSPIKALSNQKYREFKEDFGDVGLMTGDVTINPTATCLVMTTEILRSMLYRGSEIMREVGWVVFDEVHYLRDKSRGVVWEETIILLPDKVRYVFLSATIPNAMQFAEWIAKIHSQPCHVVYTDFRPTPLQHYFFPEGSDGIHLIVDEKGSFREENFSKAMATIADKAGDDPADSDIKRKGKGKNKKINKGGQKSGTSDIYKIVKMIMIKAYNPVIVFSFSKNQCEAYALQMSNLTFNDESEKSMVDKVFTNALESLADDDRQLPQIQNILPLLRRGIGIHHSGLLPILKETIEILFQEGLLKVLFATETFSIGLNMPAKTCVFTSVRKFDGQSMRYVTPSEFIQMSGRAGRRGLDERGIVIMMIDEQMEPAVAKDIVRGEQDNLNSAFHLGYNMILNLMRVEGISPEYMLEHCFLQFQSTASVSGLEQGLHNLEIERSEMKIPDEEMVRTYYELRGQINQYAKQMKDVITHPDHCLKFMQEGRLVRIKTPEHDFGWGAVITYQPRKIDRNQAETLTPQEKFQVDVLLACADNSVTFSTKSNKPTPDGLRPAMDGEKSSIHVVPVLLSCIDSISHVRLFLPNDLHSAEKRNTMRKSIDEVKRRFPDGIAVLDPVENMGIRDDSFAKIVRKIEVLESRLLSSPLHNSSRLPELYEQYEKKVALSSKIKDAKKKISAAHQILQMEELKARKRVLRRFGFINEADVVQLKARVACEISTGDELLLSELLFDGFFNDLTPEACAAILSCFVFEEKAKEVPALKDELAKPFREIQKQARVIAKVAQESKHNLNEEEYVQSFKFELMDVVYAWSKGKSFAEIW